MPTAASGWTLPRSKRVGDRTLASRLLCPNAKSVMTDASGVLIEETAFYPFGTPRNEHRIRQIEESYKFTQKERDHINELAKAAQ